MMSDKEFFDDVVEKAAILSAAGYDNEDDEPAYDPAFKDGFVAGVKWLLTRPFEQRMTEAERAGVTGAFQRIESGWLNNLSDLSAIKLYFGPLFNKEDNEENHQK